MKKSFVMYVDSSNAIFGELNLLQKGKLIDAVLKYESGDPEPKLEDPVVKMAFVVMKTQLDRDAEKYERICERRRANINKRWHKEEGKAEASDKQEYNCIQMGSDSDTDTDTANETATDTVTDTESTVVDNEKESVKKKAAAVAATPEHLLENLEKRKKAFYESLIPFVGKYGKDMVRNFFDYWSEMNKSKTKMRWETEKTWETPRRLVTWSKKQQFYGNNRTSTSESRAADAAELINRRLHPGGVST